MLRCNRQIAIKYIVQLEFHELLTDCENYYKFICGMLLKCVENTKYCIYYTKLYNVAKMAKFAK